MTLPTPIPKAPKVMSVNILDIRIDNVTMSETLDWISVAMQADPQVRQICTVNPEFVMKAQDDPAFMHLLTTTGLNLPDGIGLVIASYLLRKPLRARVPGSELVYHLAERCAKEGWRLFLLGAEEGIAAQAAAIFQQKNPMLQVAGTYAGSPAESENDAIVEMINASRADVLLVAYGAPKQDKWIFRNREALSTVRVAIGIGGSLDFVTGKATRAPVWVQKLGLEWLHRLILEPWRWRRMLALPRFILAVIFSR